jgi:alpha-ketoglutaric semialdehyde dehydrogenase
MKTYYSLIGNTESQSSTSSFQTINPRTNSPLDNQFFEAGLDDVNHAVELAKQALYPFSISKKRSDFLHLIASKLDENRESLIAVYSLESGLSFSRGEIELNRTIFQLKAFSELITTPNWDICHESKAIENRSPVRKPALLKKRFPIGVVAVFGASNFPFAYSTVGGDTAAAFAAGCPVIVKCHPFHAQTSSEVSKLVVEAVKELELPAGTFSHLLAENYTIGEELVKHPSISAIGFTGSIKGGLALQQLAQNRNVPIPVFAEMGSQNPVFIFEDAFKSETIENLAIKLIQSITGSSGQFCTQPGVLFIPKNENGDLLVSLLSNLLHEQDIESMLHKNIWQNFQQLTSLIKEQTGVKQIVSTKESSLENQGRGILSEIDIESYLSNEVFHKEVFGPHSFIVRYNQEEQLTDFILKTEGQLTISIFSENENLDHYFLFLCQQKSGRIIFNGVPTGVEVDPAMQHGGPFPSSSDSRFTAVGTDSIERFTRRITWQK